MCSSEKLPLGTLCVVCEDIATGNHYSVPSCNGCKTFFRRAFVKKSKFVCTGQGNCPVSKGGRCACRSCRFAKCLAVGMDTNSIQHDRDRIGYTKRTRKNGNALPSQASPFLGIGSSNSSGEGDNHSDRPNPLTDDEDSTFCFPSTSEDVLLDADMIGFGDADVIKPNVAVGFASLLEKMTQLENNFSLLLSRDREIVPYASLDEALHAPSRFSKPVNIKITDPIVVPDSSKDQLRHPFWRSRIIALYIDWAKTFSVFRKLPHADKIALITNHASSYMIMCEAFRTPELNSDKEIFKSTDGMNNDLNVRESSWVPCNSEKILPTDILPHFEPSHNAPSINDGQIDADTAQDNSHLSNNNLPDVVVEDKQRQQHRNSEMNFHAFFDPKLLKSGNSCSVTGVRSIVDVPPMVHYPTVGSLSGLTPVMAIVIDYVMKPFRRLNISTTEFAALQAIMFFDPDTEGLDAASQRNVFAEQKKFLSALYQHIFQQYKEEKATARYAAIILRTSTIRKVAAKKNESLQIIDMCNFFNLSNLVRETTLGMRASADEQKSIMEL